MNTVDTIDEKEFDAAVQEAKTAGSRLTIKLQEPVTYNDKVYTELSFDFGKLKGSDGLAIEEEMNQLGKPLVVPTMSGEYLIRLAAKACTEKIGSDMFGKLPLKDFNRARSAARSFLLQSE